MKGSGATYLRSLPRGHTRNRTLSPMGGCLDVKSAQRQPFFWGPIIFYFICLDVHHEVGVLFTSGQDEN